MNARELILDMLMSILEEQKMSHYVLKDCLTKHSELEKWDRAFLSRVTTGCVERKITIDMDINRFSKVKVNKMKPIIRNILRMAVYQIKYMTQVPDSAICNEAVKLAKKRGFTGLSGFVNGVLRGMLRNKEELLCEPKNLTLEEQFSYRYSMPIWLVRYWLAHYKKDKVEQMLSFFLEEKETSIRCNESKASIEQLTDMLSKEGVTTAKGHLLKEALLLKEYDSLDRLDSFQKGYFQVQDESSMLVGKIAGVQPNDYVIDVCAAPGGKALHLAELLKGTGTVDARDKTEKKVALMKENLKRTGYTNIKVKAFDALVLDETVVEKADVVIADLPCSGLGVIQKKPDIKYNITEEMLYSLASLQKEILKVVSRYVKPNGTLIFSTCTVNPKENEENVEFIERELGLQLENMESFLPEKSHKETTKSGYLQLLPGEYGTDGFFMARFKKINR